MDDAMTLLFALLSLLALVGAVGLFAMLARTSTRQTAVREFGPYAITVAATVATLATLGSLYMSEVAGYVPCRLCWVQRGFMYPLAIFLIVAAVGRWVWAWRIGLPTALVGAAIAFYHYAEQRMWVGGSDGFCDVSVPCSQIWVDRFGFVSIPFMSLTAFLFISALMWLRASTCAHTSR